MSYLTFTTIIYYYFYTHAGSDYFVNNTGDPQSNTFTVTFQSQQEDSSEYRIQIADDQILEGREYFRLRIIAVRVFGPLQGIFSVQDGVERTSVEVGIDDDDSKSRCSVDAM